MGAMQNETVKNIGKGGGALAMVGGFVGDAFNVVSAVGAFKASQEEGDHIAISATKGAADFVIGETFYGAMASEMGLAGSLGMGFVAAGFSMGANLTAKHMENTAEKLGKGSESVKALGSGHFNMTQAGYTMRQRSLNAIRSNGANINSAFGNEARNYYLGL